MDATRLIKTLLPARCVVYVMDAYCGWCWGFSARIVEFEAANRHRVPFTAISGGLFTGKRARPISTYPHIPEANTRIARLAGAHFGEAYKRVLEEGRLVMNSSDAAAALAALRDLAPQKAIHWAREVQEAFYARGQSLSEPDTIAGIAAAEGFDAAEVLGRLQDGSAHAQAASDFALARQLGVSTYPTLLFVDGPKVQSLPATGTALEVLNERLDALLSNAGAQRVTGLGVSSFRSSESRSVVGP
jgi:putative protein-disulfide isomerase